METTVKCDTICVSRGMDHLVLCQQPLRQLSRNATKPGTVLESPASSTTEGRNKCSPVMSKPHMAEYTDQFSIILLFWVVMTGGSRVPRRC